MKEKDIVDFTKFKVSEEDENEHIDENGNEVWCQICYTHELAEKILPIRLKELVNEEDEEDPQSCCLKFNRKTEKENFSMGYKSIEEQKQAARNTNELLDHLRRIIEQNDERFSFEWLVGGEHATMEIFDKEKKIGYAVKIEPIEYENGEVVNL